MDFEKITELEQIAKDTKNTKQNLDNTYLDDCTSQIDITRLYLKEICKYPLLSIEEEFKLGQDLKLVDGLKNITKKQNNINIYEIDLSIVFKLCCNNKIYKFVIESLLEYYKTKSSNKLIYEQLNKYNELAKKRNRSLNFEELEEYFQIKNKDCENLTDKELLQQINNYICYKRAFDKMFNSNLRLVVNIAKKYHFGNLEILDIISEGNIGLMKAIGNFDSSLGFRFSAYAKWQIRRTIQSFILSENNELKTPENLSNYINILKRKISKLEQVYQRKPSLDEISLELKIPVSELKKYLSYEYDVISLQQTTGEENEEIGNLISSNIDIEEEVMINILKKDIKQLYEVLTNQELDVIKMRYGLEEYDGKIYSICDIGKKYEVTHQRISQIQKSALKKMKTLVKKNKFCGSLEDYLKK